MGGIWLTRAELHGTIGELVGYKSGLAVTSADIARVLLPEYGSLWNGGEDDVVRLRAEVYEGIFASVLYRLGNIRTADTLPAPFVMMQRYQDDEEIWPIAEAVMNGYYEDMRAMFRNGPPTQGTTYDPTGLAMRLKEEHGFVAVALVLEYLELVDEQMHRNPWSRIRRIEWQDVLELNELFTTQGVSASHGVYFDQRYIDYLTENFGRIDSINWRRFEGLTCEFFERAGFQVEIGPGSGDDGVDARIWLPDTDRTRSPLIVVQCKRQKSKIEKVVVKALYADVLDNDARLGLVVTTSTLSPGAETTRTGRGYPIQVADRQTLRSWLSAMRTPGSGVFLGR